MRIPHRGDVIVIGNADIAWIKCFVVFGPRTFQPYLTLPAPSLNQSSVAKDSSGAA